MVLLIEEKKCLQVNHQNPRPARWFFPQSITLVLGSEREVGRWVMRVAAATAANKAHKEDRKKRRIVKKGSFRFADSRSAIIRQIGKPVSLVRSLFLLRSMMGDGGRGGFGELPTLCQKCVFCLLKRKKYKWSRRARGSLCERWIKKTEEGILCVLCNRGRISVVVNFRNGEGNPWLSSFVLPWKRHQAKRE